MNLSDALNNSESPDARRKREAPPTEATFDDHGRVNEVAVNLSSIPQTEQEHREEIRRVLNLEIPDDREVVIKSVRWWGPPDNLNVYTRFDIRDRPEDLQAAEVDPVELLRGLRGGKTRTRGKTVYAGDGTLVVSWNDWQVGKREGGGTAALLERLDSAYDAIVDRAKFLRKVGIGELVIIGGGDMGEGCDMFPNHAFEIDLDRREQNRVTTTAILEGLDRIAPLFDRVAVVAVGGNHGENRIGHKRTTRSDNDDCAVFENAAVASDRDVRLSHVDFRIANGEIAKTISVAGWILGTTHGQAYGKSMSGSVEQKVYKWFQGQAAGRHPAGDSDVLVTHHFHHYAARDWGACQWLQTPAMDGGSAWVSDMNGQYSEPGMLTFVMTPEKRINDIHIV